ncbi:hypothetical protein Tco_1438254 [Tanacetum coccineum]
MMMTTRLHVINLESIDASYRHTDALKAKNVRDVKWDGEFGCQNMELQLVCEHYQPTKISNLSTKPRVQQVIRSFNIPVNDPSVAIFMKLDQPFGSASVLGEIINYVILLQLHVKMKKRACCADANHILLSYHGMV